MSRLGKRLGVALCLAVSALSFPALADEPALPDVCRHDPDASMCRDLKDITFYLGFSCQGDACYQVFRNQGTAMSRFTWDYPHYRDLVSYPSIDVGNLGASAAAAICAARATGDCDWMQYLFERKAEALRYLRDLQEDSGLSPAIDCQVSYQCP